MDARGGWSWPESMDALIAAPGSLVHHRCVGGLRLPMHPRCRWVTARLV
jgi:hypothetical protein